MRKRETIGTVLIILFLPFVVFLAALGMSYLYLLMDRPQTPPIPCVTGSPCMQALRVELQGEKHEQRRT